MREQDSRILPRLGSAAVNGSIIKIFKRKKLTTRTYCPAANTVAGIFKTLIRGERSEIYNIGISEPEISVRELIDLVNQYCGQSIAYEFIEPTSVYIDEPLRRCPDISKAISEIGYTPSVSLESGLQQFFRWSNSTYQGIHHD